MLPATLLCRQKQRDGAFLIRWQVKHLRRPVCRPQPQLIARPLPAVVKHQPETRRVATKHRLGPPDADLQAHQIAEGVQHGQHRHHAQQKRQHIAQTQRVVDVAQQHQHQHPGQRKALPGGDDENPPLHQCDGAHVDLRAEQPGAETLAQGNRHSRKG